MGYYNFAVEIDGNKHQCEMIVTPAACWSPDAIQKGKRVWGISAQLYALRSDENWGCGDFSDLQMLVEKSVGLKTDVIGLNPLHALFPTHPQHYAPYTPSNRLFLNTLYIDVTKITNFAECEEIKRLRSDPGFQRALTAARNAPLVDYAAVAALKNRTLEVLYKDFCKYETPASFMRFREEGGPLLEGQGTFDALCEYFQDAEGQFTAWQNWPVEYQSFQSPSVKEFVGKNTARVTYYIWLQWLADTQLARVQEKALERGMALGLYRDLAVGSDKSGAEVWMNPSVFMQDVGIGAPPDEYNPQGQNWGLPALNPFILKANGYRMFRDLLRANMRHARALRIDHAFGLCRLYLIPDGKKSSEGAYVSYAFDEMLAVLKLESHRNRCMVIGEDLGTFPPQYKQGAEAAGVLSYKLLYFEHDANGDFTPPDRYPAQALATLSTHDLPTYKGWLQSADINERAELNLYPSEKLLAGDRKKRPEEVALLKKALIKENLCRDDDMTPSITAVETYLARASSIIVMVQLEDVLGLCTQANLPTTTTERPNWRIRLPETIEAITAQQGALSGIAEQMNAERTRPLLQVPRATYRLQLHKGFTFFDAVKIIPYLAKLGISHIYTSPYLTARPGSQHGYDITDHNVFNPELGGKEGFDAFLARLNEHKLKHILDFVPNHMGVGGSDNAWWLNVLEWGRQSPFAAYFDIDWSQRYPGVLPKLILPFLGDHYGDILSKGELELKFDPQHGSFAVWYATHCFPVCPEDYSVIMPEIRNVSSIAEGQALKAELINDRNNHDAIIDAVAGINADRQQLHALLERQHYRLAFWRVAASDINYRRFFDITDLAGIRPEVPQLFQDMHRLVLSLLHQGKLSGLRIDHIDGLADPARYCRTLREQAGAGAYIIVEKILAVQENLPENWLIQGTSGYDALNIIGDVLVNPKGEKTLTRVYQRFSGVLQSVDEMVASAKILILETTLASELQALSFLAKRIAEKDVNSRDYTLDTLKQTLKDIIACFPVYRSYVTEEGAQGPDILVINWGGSKSKEA